MSASDASQGTERTASLSRADTRALLTTCVAAAARGAEVVRSGADRRASLVWETKGHNDFVSEVDRASEAVIAEIIAGRHSDATLVAEEGSPNLSHSRGLVFIADPLDGTTNFLHGLPWYAVSVAALVDGEVIAGATINAASGELFTATLGGGARRAGEAIRVSAITEPGRSLIATGFPWTDVGAIAGYVKALPAVMSATAGIRRCGAAALDLADVACGRYEAFWEPRLNAWDMAAGSLLVREAGGIVTTMDGAPCPVAATSIIAGNPATHAWLLDTLRTA
ncbi:MAG TPA: inositol monophosphatase family protein [Gemmatimonadaceae bacterium]|jgi:myo-inositol-1(or 4)-monophosphatase|nr:inositol monophosphatase family protein [Gemmatimonadaceae bacterium]